MDRPAFSSIAAIALSAGLLTACAGDDTSVNDANEQPSGGDQMGASPAQGTASGTEPPAGVEPSAPGVGTPPGVVPTPPGVETPPSVEPSEPGVGTPPGADPTPPGVGAPPSVEPPPAVQPSPPAVSPPAVQPSPPAVEPGVEPNPPAVEPPPPAVEPPAMPPSPPAPPINVEKGECPAELVAFPCAEGYGKAATGGRGGDVFIVTTLNSSGAGSLGEALGATGPRTVVFEVGGTIEGDFSITKGDVTVAGQTAPGDGIAIHGHLTVDANNTIIRYLRVRGDGNGDIITNNHNRPKNTQMYDHLSASWSSDEIFSVYFNTEITIQYSMITEANSGSHQFGGIWGGNHNSMHHNLFAHNTSRNPRLASGSGFNDFRNNVLFNTRRPIHGGEKHEVGNDPDHVVQSCNVVANYVKPGPVNMGLNLAGPGSRDGKDDAGDWYVADNILHGDDEVTADNWKGVSGTYNKLDAPGEHEPIMPQTAEEAYETVLAHAGCAKPKRDSMDTRIIEEVRTGNVESGNGLKTSPGPLPQLQAGTAPPDTDRDGMPDAWEMANGLDANNPEDRNTTDALGYTMLEVYMNSLDDF